MLGLSTAAVRYDLSTRIGTLVLTTTAAALRQFRGVLPRIFAYKALLSPVELNEGCWKIGRVLLVR